MSCVFHRLYLVFLNGTKCWAREEIIVKGEGVNVFVFVCLCLCVCVSVCVCEKWGKRWRTSSFQTADAALAYFHRATSALAGQDVFLLRLSFRVSHAVEAANKSNKRTGGMTYHGAVRHVSTVQQAKSSVKCKIKDTLFVLSDRPLFLTYWK